MKEFLEYGITGVLALVIVVIFAPKGVVRAFLHEVREARLTREAAAVAERQERKEMRDRHAAFLANHIAHNTKALEAVSDGLSQVCRRLNGGDKRGTI